MPKYYEIIEDISVKERILFQIGMSDDMTLKKNWLPNTQSKQIGQPK